MNKEDQHMEFRNRIIAYLASELKPAEKASFEKEIAGDSEKLAIFEAYGKIWTGVDQLAARDKYDVDKEWGMFLEKLDLKDKEQKDIKESMHSDSLPFRTMLIRIAAVVLIGLLGVSGWYVGKSYFSFEQVALETGTKLISLPDGSRVTLNAGSSLKYSMETGSGVRTVILKGEAFFEVERDTLRPFIITAGGASIEVLGTSFNVNAYRENDVVEVSVNSGLVSLSSKQNSSELIILNPGNTGVFNQKRKSLALIAEADKNVFAWKTRELIFEDTPLSEVVKVISHVYQVNVSLADEALAMCRITVSFSDQELGAVLNVVGQTLDLEIIHEDDGILLLGDGCQ